MNGGSADIYPKVQVKELLVFQAPYNDKAMFLIWRCILLSPNDIYLSRLCLKEIYNLFLKAALNLLFKPSNFVLGLIPRTKLMVVPLILTCRSK